MFTLESYQKNINLILQGLYPNGEPGIAIFILKNNKPVIKKGFGLANLQTKEKITSDTNFRMASVSKQFTAMCILMLTEKKELALKDPLNKFFSDLPVSIQNITVHQLLNHTSGIMDYELLIPPDQQKQILDKDVLQLIRRNGSIYFSSGTKFKYSNTGYCLLALIVEKVSGKLYADFIHENIFQPLQMGNSRMYEPEKNIPNRAYGYHHVNDVFELADQNMTSATLGDGGVYTSLNDYAKWINGLSDHSLISKRLTSETFKQQVAVNENIGYGFGWFIGKETDGFKCIFHSGESIGFRNMAYYNLDKKLLITLFSNRDDDAIAKAFDKITKFLGIRIEFASTREVSLLHWLSNIYQD